VALASLADGSRVYVACAATGEIIEVNVATWSTERRIAAGPGSGELALSPDGRTLLVGNAAKQSLALIDLTSAAGTPLPVALPGQPVAITVSSDNRYAFVTLTRPDSELAMVSAIDLASHAVATSLTYGRRLAGIAFWKVQP
jgi:DNA-binding beta-propeller fold protein YncE